jgi:signal transduction histidine kinase
VSFRSRLLIAFALAAIIPLGLLAYGVRRQLTARLVTQHEQRVQALARVVERDLQRESASVATRLESIARALRTDDRFRLGDRAYVLDWGERAMRTSGLSMLQLHDADGRIVSSGHFRNEFDRLQPELPRLVRAASGAVLVRARAPEGPFLALTRVDSVVLGDRRYDIVGGVRVDSAFLRRFAVDDGLAVSLETPADSLRAGSPAGTSAADVVAAIQLAYTDADSTRLASATLRIAYTIPELETLRRDVDRWFLGAMALVVTAAVLLAAWLSSRLSGPLTNLAQAMSSIDLDSPDLAIAAGRDDELGTLARRLGSLSARLRASASRLRQAERRATVGDMARQVNHDIKNGLIPIRNVLRHLVQVQEQDPQQLASVFAERRATLESSVGYLDTLARNYARLTPRVDRRAVDVNGIVQELVASSATSGGVNLRTRLSDGLPRANGDPVIVRRIIDNLVRNAIESIDGRGGDVTITTARARDGAVMISVGDTGRGMSEDELSRAFDDFFTTKPDGTGLGLSVVRRLTADLHGSVRVESAPGKGTTFTIELPACTPS